MGCEPYRIIIVEHIYPPIPDRRFDYQAVFDGYEPGDPIGHGPTEQAAIDDLHEQLDEEIDFDAWLKTPQGQDYQRGRQRIA